MTVSTTTSRADYTGNGVTTAFAVPFYFLDNSHLLVLRTQISTSTTTTLTLGTDYTVSGAGVGAGGTITCTVAPTDGQKLSILRNVPLTQLTHYVENDPFPAASHERALDQLTMEVQQLNEAQSRALTLSKATTGVSAALPNPASNLVIGWDSTGTSLVNVDANTLATSVTYGQTKSQAASGNGSATVFTLSSTAATVNNVQVFISGVRQRPTTDYSLASDGVTLTFTSAPPLGTGNILFVWQSVLPATSVPDLGVNTSSIVDSAVTTSKIAANAVTPAKLANSGYELGMRNRIINGNFDVWQRGTAFASGVAGQYGPDRWQVYRAGNAAGATFTRSGYAGNNPTGSNFALRMQRDSGNTSTAEIIASTSFETIDVQRLRGTTVTVSFWALKGANYSGSTASLSVQQGTGTDGNLYTGFTGQSSIGSVAISQSLFTRYSVTVQVGATASQLGIAVGYTPTGTAGAADYIEITGVQLEVGSTATPFEYRPYGTELALCQRYYFSSGSGSFVTPGGGTNNSYQFKVTMRSSPTLTITPASGSIIVAASSGDGFVASNSVQSVATVVASAEL